MDLVDMASLLVADIVHGHTDCDSCRVVASTGQSDEDEAAQTLVDVPGMPAALTVSTA